MLPKPLWIDPQWNGQTTNCVYLPSFIDICCDPGFPGFPLRETPDSLRAAALSGGFLDLLLSPAVEPIRDTPEQFTPQPAAHVQFYMAAAATLGLQGEHLSEVGLLIKAGAAVFSDGGRSIASTLVLRQFMEYTARFNTRLLLRPADTALDALGVVNESMLSAWIGLRGNPPETEEIGITRILALLRALPQPPAVHLSHIGTARGVQLIQAARSEGLPISASTPARNLLIDENCLKNGGYDSLYRLHPPLRTAQDREALLQGVCDGVLFLSADHQPRAPEEKEHEFERAVPGSTGLQTAALAAYTAFKLAGLSTEQALRTLSAALSESPREWLQARPAGWVCFEPEAQTEVAPAKSASLARNDALNGLKLQGAIRAVGEGLIPNIFR